MAWDSNAATAQGRREAAVRETGVALDVARRVPFDLLVLHLGQLLAEGNPQEISANPAVITAYLGAAA